MHVELLFPNRFLKSSDLHGQDVTLTIMRINPKEELRRPGGAVDKKPCLYFEEASKKAQRSGEEEKRLVLNKTNAGTITEMYGNETDDWIGAKVTIYPTTTRCGSRTVDCIRIREQIPEAQKGGQ